MKTTVYLFSSLRSQGVEAQIKYNDGCEIWLKFPEHDKPSPWRTNLSHLIADIFNYLLGKHIIAWSESNGYLVAQTDLEDMNKVVELLTKEIKIGHRSRYAKC